MFIAPGSQQSARIWTPCLDSLWDRCTWELEITVPRNLANEGETLVVATGELMEMVRAHA
jgi:transcription initiation factor TFIID subunit 2